MEGKIVWQNILKFIKQNKRYLIVLLIFMVSIWYSKLIPDVKKIKDNKKQSYQSNIELKHSTLSKDKAFLIYEDIFDAIPGDFYKISFYAKSVTSGEKLVITALSNFGEEKEIKVIELNNENGEEKYYELIFQADQHYQHIKLSKEENLNQVTDKWEDGQIFLAELKVQRMGVENQTAVKNLKPTFVGMIDFIETASKNKKEFNEKILSKKNEVVKQSFLAQGDVIASINFNFEIVGNGGKGKYIIRLISSSDKKNIKEFNFSAKGIKEKMSDKDGYSVDFFTAVTKGQKYYIEIDNDKVNVDKKNYLQFKKIKTNKNNAYFIVNEIILTKVKEKETIMVGAKIEDFGDRLVYSYKNNNTTRDILNVFDYNGKLEFKGKVLVNKSKSGNYYTYKVNTIVPFTLMRISARQEDDTKSSLVRIEYSYDNKYWREVDYSQKDKGADYENGKIMREVGYNILNNASENSIIYIKISYAGEAIKKKRNFGLEKFEIRALLAE